MPQLPITLSEEEREDFIFEIEANYKLLCEKEGMEDRWDEVELHARTWGDQELTNKAFQYRNRAKVYIK